MHKVLIRFIGLLLLSPLASAAGIVEMPESQISEMCRVLSDESGDCVKGKTLQHSQTIKLDGDQLLSFFHVKNDTKRVPLSVPLSLNAQGKWKLGEPFIGEVKRIDRDAKGRLWMQANYFFLANKPIMYLSLDGLTWKGVDLPFDGDSGVAMHQRGIERWCVSGETLFIELLMSSSAEGLSKRFWQANVKTLQTDNKNAGKKWQVAYKQSLEGLACESVQANSNDWDVQGGETLSLLLLDKNKLTVKLPKDLVVGAGAAKKEVIAKAEPDNQAKKETVAKGKFAIQVAAYRQHQLTNDVVKILQKATFMTFTRTPDSNGQSLKKVYIGPFQSRDEAAKNLATFKEKFKDNKSYQSAFIIRLP